MSIHAAGPRLFSSIPFRHIAKNRKGSGGGGAAVNVALNVTPFVDMMTILVTFLLMVFSATGELVSAQKGLSLPNAVNKDILKKAPIIIITRDHVTFQGEQIAIVSDLERETSLEWKIVSLYDRLRLEKQAFITSGYNELNDKERSYCEEEIPNRKPEEICLKGLLILQADKDTSAKVLNRVIKTAYAAEYPNIMFAVNQRSTRQ